MWSHEDQQDKLTHLSWHLRLFSSMSVCGLIKTWLPNEHSPLKPAERLVQRRRRGLARTGRLPAPYGELGYKSQLSRQARGASHMNIFTLHYTGMLIKDKNKFLGFFHFYFFLPRAYGRIFGPLMTWWVIQPSMPLQGLSMWAKSEPETVLHQHTLGVSICMGRLDKVEMRCAGLETTMLHNKQRTPPPEVQFMS